MEIRIKDYHCFLPTRRHTVGPAFSTALTLAVGSPDLPDFDVVDSFNCVLYLSLVGPLVHLKRVRPFDVRKMHSLLGNERPNYDTIVIHINTR